MVAAVGWLVGYTGAGSLAVGGITLMNGAALTLAGTALNIGGALLLSAVTAPSMNTPTPDNVQSNSKVADGPRVRHYGVVKAGGTVVFHRAKDGVGYYVIVHGHGEISRVLQYYLNNEPVGIAESAFTIVEEPSYLQEILGASLGFDLLPTDRSYQVGMW